LGSGQSEPVGLSCPSASFCIAVGTDGSVYTYNRTSWTAGAKIDVVNGTSLGLGGVSCPSASFCMAFEGGGNWFQTFNGHTWSSPAMADTGIVFNSLSCPSASFCMGIDPNHALTWRS